MGSLMGEGSSVFDVGTYAYPWDIVGDPEAPAVLAGLGVDHVTVAALYHATRALTPRHPGHRVVVAGHTALYFPLDPQRWAGAAWRPAAQTWMPETDPFGASAAALATVGLPVHAWVVVSHVDPPGGSEVGPVVVNAYGDRYPWALCPAREQVRDYAVRLAAETAARPEVSGIEFEACGWYGFDHLHTHDKVAGVPLDQADQFLFSLCFCLVCEAEYRHVGLDPKRLAGVVRRALDVRFHGRGATGMQGEIASIEAALGTETAHTVLRMRRTVADRLRDEVVREVRDVRPQDDFPVVFHGNPRAHRSTAFTGLDPATVPVSTDGIIVNCWGEPSDAAETVSLAAKAAPQDLRILASMVGVRGFGAQAERTPRTLDAVRSAGASGIRIYHAGLASADDLAAIRELVTLAHAPSAESSEAPQSSEPSESSELSDRSED